MTIHVARQPAEFEAQEALWLIWPQSNHKRGYSCAAVTLEIIAALKPHLLVHICAAHEALLAEAEFAVDARFSDRTNVVFHVIPSTGLWVRDMGPTFAHTANGQLVVIDFNFNSWGYAHTSHPNAQLNGRFAALVAEQLGLPVLRTSMISEGGNREVNGKGVLLTSASVEEGRNPNLTRADMETEYARLLGITKTIWLEQGVREDDHSFLGPLQTADGTLAYTVFTTNGHIDEFARFIDPHTIALGYVPKEDLHSPIARENYRRMERNYRILQTATDQDGNPFRVVRMPLPRTLLHTLEPGDTTYDSLQALTYTNGSTFPDKQPIQVAAAGSYLNFVITPQVVLGQRFYQPGMDDSIRKRDETVEHQLRGLFPRRTVVMLDAMAINLGGGGLHCITMHQPTTPHL